MSFPQRSYPLRALGEVVKRSQQQDDLSKIVRMSEPARIP
jgi:hypothetical protein